MTAATWLVIFAERFIEDDMTMETCPVFEMDNIKIPFTPEGKISVIDAIKALTKSKHSQDMWKRITRRNPAIMKHCELYQNEHEEPFLAVDIKGWDKISFFLFEELASDQG